ncbi:zinc-binding dehydrogenase [Streptomyces sp. NPDC029526]|uniref:alcohol dehydrogenase catalytic domain-containing protein n=1 Tax=Streptomyces sp. NPDC029526 TaxID=3155728 RepID=UPI0033C878D8
MKAWQFNEVNAPFTLVEREDPKPGADEIVIDVKASGLCHSDVSFVDGTLTPILGHRPIILGHETAGVVSAIGADVSAFAVGDRVGIPAVTEGPGTAVDGGFADKVVVKADLVVRVPDEVDFSQAAPAMDAARTSYRALVTFGRVEAGQNVGIIGFGGLGSLGAQIAKELGAEVYVAEINEKVWDDAKALGVAGVSQDIRDFADRGLDVIVDFAGFGTTTASAIDAVRHGGRIVQIGLAREEATLSMQQVILKEITLVGAANGEKSEAEEVLRLMAGGNIESKIVPITFEQIPEYVDKLAKGEVPGRAVAIL